MKNADIKADGTVYWFERANDWGNYIGESYDRGQVVRVDSKRYDTSGYSWSTKHDGVESAKGKYIAVRFTERHGSAPQDAIHYVLPTQVRDTYAAVKERYEATQAADRAAIERRERRVAKNTDEAAELRDRLADLGLDDLFYVRSTEGRVGNKYLGSVEPSVKVDFVSDYKRSEADALRTLIERVESIQYKARKAAQQ